MTTSPIRMQPLPVLAPEDRLLTPNPTLPADGRGTTSPQLPVQPLPVWTDGALDVRSIGAALLA